MTTGRFVRYVRAVRGICIFLTRSSGWEPLAQAIVEVAGHRLAIPFVLEMTFLAWDADNIRPESRNAVSMPAAHARINESVAVLLAERARKGLARMVLAWTEYRGTVLFRQEGSNVMKACLRYCQPALACLLAGQDHLHRVQTPQSGGLSPRSPSQGCRLRSTPHTSHRRSATLSGSRG